ncbi:tyrosine-type recombinase/integrase [Candidatus Saccharibacteria bacterium]|nr:tyrosine-type recombinase/integrase [Candidatus Saccharibacteria bacterium]
MNVELKVQIALINKQKVPDKDERMSYTRAEIEKALFYADLREKIMIILFFDTGMRLGELRNLRLQNIKKRSISFIGKGRKLGFAMMSDKTYEQLQFYIKKNKITDYIFPGKDETKPLSPQQIERSLKKVFTKAGFPEFHPHMLRHSFVMDLLLVQGLGVRQIQYLINHSKLETTEHYIDRITKDQRRELWESQRFRNGYSNRPVIRIEESKAF